MSWISNNHEKAAVGVGGFAFLALGFLGYGTLKKVNDEFSARAIGNGGQNASIEFADQVVVAISSFELERTWEQNADGDRKVDLFTGVPLFVNRDDKKNPVDLPVSKPVHPPVPNMWWIEHRLDPGFADSPARDADLDGFSNLEEFNAQTNPIDKASYPNLMAKLSYVRDEALQWVLRPGFMNEKGGFTFDYNDSTGAKNRIKAANSIAPNDLFFDTGVAKKRFKYLGFEVKREMNERIRAEVDVTMVKIEDQKPNKKGMIYEIPAQFRKRNAAKFSYFDRTVILTLSALGRDGEEIIVQEFESFALPQDSDDKRYKITSVTPEEITIQETVKDAELKIYRLKKGTIGATSAVAQQ